MSAATDLHHAIAALLPPVVAIGGGQVTPEVFDTTARDKPTGPYYVLAVRIPDVLARSEAATTHGHTTIARVTSVGWTPTAARDLACAAEAALDQARPVVDGWNTGPLLLINTRGPDEDRDVIFTNGATAIYTVSEFELTASRTA